MSQAQSQSNPANMHTFARWRPLSVAEKQHSEPDEDNGELKRNITLDKENRNLYSITVWPPTTATKNQEPYPQRLSTPRSRPWKSQASFKHVFDTDSDNAHVFEGVVEEAIPKVLGGASCKFFAYGHTGSGKTHTIVGVENGGGDGEDEDRRSVDVGLLPIAAKRLFEALEKQSGDVAGRENTKEFSKLGVSLSLFELRKNVAVDLLNNGTKCHIREGADGKMHVRGEAEVLDDGKVRVKPIEKKPCWTYEDFFSTLREGLRLRSVGTSSVHDQSSRTHAILELEIVSPELVQAREALYERQAELVVVGKRATDVYLEETWKTLVKGDDGIWRSNPDRPKNQAIIDAAEAEKAEYEHPLVAAEEYIDLVLSSAGGNLGGKMVFVNLAGSEYYYGNDATSSAQHIANQTPQEKREGRQINTDLLALKEVIRAINSKQKRVPFRSSPLTMVLREHFLDCEEGTSAMIVAVSPATQQHTATLNSLKCGSSVGAACA